MLIINNRFLSLYDYNFLLVIEKIFSVNSKICQFLSQKEEHVFEMSLEAVFIIIVWPSGCRFFGIVCKVRTQDPENYPVVTVAYQELSSRFIHHIAKELSLSNRRRARFLHNNGSGSWILGFY